MSLLKVKMMLLSSIFCCVFAVNAKELLIVDTDLHQNADDYEALVMLQSPEMQKRFKILGVTLVAGNHNLNQIEIDTLKLIERLGREAELHVYRGADRPLIHDREVFRNFEKARYGSEYAGAWTESEKVVVPVDGSPKLSSQPMHAANYIVDTVRQHPNEITIVALGPLTNIALAFRLAPDIVPLVKEIIYMGGSFFYPGNVTPSAEFNWWFDAEAAHIVLGQPIKHTVIPLDATDKILFDKDIYDMLVAKYPFHPMTTMYLKPKFEQVFSAHPTYSIPVWDALVPAYMCNPSIVEDQEELWVSVDGNHGPNYGRSTGLPTSRFGDAKPYFEAQKANVIMALNEAEFWKMYEKLFFQ